MEEYYVSTDNMAVGYGGKALIENICLHVRRGEILTLIGPNGSGKSTILKSIIRQLNPIRGTVYLDGKAMDRMPEDEIAKHLSVLMTERIHPELMTCRDVGSTGRYPYTGRLGILSREDRNIVTNVWNWCTPVSLRSGIFPKSATDSASASFWPGHCVRSRRSLCWMSPLPFWTSGTSWSCSPS